MKCQNRSLIFSFFRRFSLNNFFHKALQRRVRDGKEGQAIDLTSLKNSEAKVERQKFGGHFPDPGTSISTQKWPCASSYAVNERAKK